MEEINALITDWLNSLFGELGEDIHDPMTLSAIKAKQY